jgi:hypothetical protein
MYCLSSSQYYTLKKVTIRSPKALLNSYQTSQSRISDDILYSDHTENLAVYLLVLLILNFSL